MTGSDFQRPNREVAGMTHEQICAILESAVVREADSEDVFGAPGNFVALVSAHPGEPWRVVITVLSNLDDNLRRLTRERAEDSAYALLTDADPERHGFAWAPAGPCWTLALYQQTRTID